MSIIGFVGFNAAAATPTGTDTSDATESTIATTSHDVVTVDHNGGLGVDTNLNISSKSNTSTDEPDPETYLLILDDDLTVGPTQTSADVDRAKRRAERIQAPVVDQLEDKNIDVTTQFWITNAIITTVDPNDVTPADLEAVDGVTRVERDVEFTQPEPQSSTETALTGEKVAAADGVDETTYGLDQINLEQFIDEYNTNGSGTRVAIIDDGLDETHPDINVTLGVNVSGETVSDPATTTLQRESGHGDHVAGIATGTTTPAGDIARYSVAPDAELLKADVFVGGATLTDIIAAIQWAVEEDADVVSMSLGLSASDTNSTVIISIEDAIQNANDAGTVVIGSTGNERADSTDGPVASLGAEFSSFSIGASNDTGGVSSFSSGAIISPDTTVVLEDGSRTPAKYPDHYPYTYIKPDVTAPGVDVVSAGPLGTVSHTDPVYSTASGTSMAAPHVAGAVALLQSATTTQRDPDVLTNALVETARKPDQTDVTSRDIRYGTGVIDLLAAREALDSTTPIDGTVTGADDTLTGATITTDSGVVAATDNGAYSIEPTTDSRSVAVTADEYRYVPQTMSVETGDTTTIDFNLEKIESIRLTLDDDQIGTTGATTSTVIAEHTDGTESDISQEAVLTASNATIATIDGTTISGNNAGTTTITVHYDGFTTETTLEVREPDRIELSVDGHQTTTSIINQETVPYTIDAIFDDGSTESITDSADLRFASDQNSTALSIDTHTATITGTEPAENVRLVATDGNFEDTINITVTRSELKDISLELSASTVTTSGNVTATVIGTYADSTDRVITDNAAIEVGDTNIATIENETITGISAGTTPITATVGNETVSGDLTVVDPAFFDVNVTDHPSSVVEGENLTLNYTVTNTGELTDTQAISISVNGTEHATTEALHLDPNGTVTNTVTYQTKPGDAPGVNVSIASENVTVTELVAVDAPPEFAVTIDESESPTTITKSDSVVIVAEIKNVGTLTGTELVTWTLERDENTIVSNTTNVTLSGQSTTTIQMTAPTSDLELGEYLVTIDSGGDIDTQPITLEQERAVGGGTGSSVGGSADDSGADDTGAFDDEESLSTPDSDTQIDDEDQPSASETDSGGDNEERTPVPNLRAGGTESIDDSDVVAGPSIPTDATDDTAPTGDSSETSADAHGFGLVITLIAVLVVARVIE